MLAVCSWTWLCLIFKISLQTQATLQVTPFNLVTGIPGMLPYLCTHHGCPTRFKSQSGHTHNTVEPLITHTPPWTAYVMGYGKCCNISKKKNLSKTIPSHKFQKSLLLLYFSYAWLHLCRAALKMYLWVSQVLVPKHCPPWQGNCWSLRWPEEHQIGPDKAHPFFSHHLSWWTTASPFP